MITKEKRNLGGYDELERILGEATCHARFSVNFLNRDSSHRFHSIYLGNFFKKPCRHAKK